MLPDCNMGFLFLDGLDLLFCKNSVSGVSKQQENTRQQDNSTRREEKRVS